MTNDTIQNLGCQNFNLGNTTELGQSVKLFSILVCFLLAFLLSTQSVRYYRHTNILINVPVFKNRTLAVSYITRAHNRGSYFWLLRLRAYYSFPLFLWVLGLIPMFSCCLILVFVLYFIDMYSGFGAGGEDPGVDGCCL